MRRLLRFRLRGLLILLTLMSVGLGWYASNARARSAELKAIARIHALAPEFGGALGGNFYLNYPSEPYTGCFRMGQIGEADFVAHSPEWLTRLLENFDIRVTHRGERVRIAGSGYDRRAPNPGAEFLWSDPKLMGYGVDDRIIEHLLAFKSVRLIKLTHTRVSESGIRTLREAFPKAEIQVIPPTDSQPTTEG